MKFLSCTLLTVLFTAVVLGQSPSTTTDATTTSVTSEDPIPTTVLTTSEDPITTTSTSAPTTTPEPPTTTPEPPTTTASPEPPTTTVTTSTSTAAPTTTAAPSTSQAPPPTTPIPVPDDCSWNVTKDNVTCIRAQLKALFIIPIEGEKEYIVLGQNASDVQSSCTLSNDTQSLVLTDTRYTLTMIFAKEADKFFVNETIFEYSLPEGRGSVSSYARIFTVKVGNSYMCKTLTDIKLENVTMEVQDMHIQAFLGEGTSNFGTVEECEPDDKVSDAVPIAVGCALAALIIIVLIAYLVGRRQSRQKGYQSV